MQRSVKNLTDLDWLCGDVGVGLEVAIIGREILYVVMVDEPFAQTPSFLY